MIHDSILGLPLRTLVEQLPFDVWVRDREDRCVYANAAALAHWPNALGRTASDMDVAPETRALWQANNARALAGELVRGEVRFAGEENVYYQMIIPFRAEDGSVIGTVGINLNITSEVTARTEAEELRALLQQLFEHAPLPMGLRAVRDGDLVHLDDNPVCAALFGATPKALRGRTDRDLGIPAERVDRAIARFRQARQRGAPVPFEMTLDLPTGVRTLTGSALALPGDDEERYAFVAQDETAVRSLQTRLVRADRLISLGTLSASIAHEIRNPAALALAHIELAVEQAEKTPNMPAEMLDDLRAAALGIQRVASLVQDIQRLVLADEPVSEVVDLGAVTATVLALLRAELRNRGVRVEAPSAGATHLRGSALRVTQILLNLVQNSMQSFERSGGHVWITASATDRGTVLVHVDDDGPGIDPNVRERLFEPFVTTKRSGAGTGLGLYVSRLLAERMGGRLDARERPGGGTRIELELPGATP